MQLKATYNFGRESMVDMKKQEAARPIEIKGSMILAPHLSTRRPTPGSKQALTNVAKPYASEKLVSLRESPSRMGSLKAATE